MTLTLNARPATAVTDWDAPTTSTRRVLVSYAVQTEVEGIWQDVLSGEFSKEVITQAEIDELVGDLMDQHRRLDQIIRVGAAGWGPDGIPVTAYQESRLSGWMIPKIFTN